MLSWRSKSTRSARIASILSPQSPKLLTKSRNDPSKACLKDNSFKECLGQRKTSAGTGASPWLSHDVSLDVNT